MVFLRDWLVDAPVLPFGPLPSSSVATACRTPMRLSSIKDILRHNVEPAQIREKNGFAGFAEFAGFARDTRSLSFTGVLFTFVGTKLITQLSILTAVKFKLQSRIFMANTN